MARREISLLVAERFFRWARDNQVPQTRIAAKMGVKAQAVTNWKTKGVPADKWNSVADLMSIPTDVLVAPAKNVDIVCEKPRYLPIIDCVHAGNWQGLGDNVYEEYMPVLTSCSKDSFCLRVKGDSMVPVFLEGDVVTVDPERKPMAGKYVVAVKANENEATIKRYRARGINERGDEVFELIPENQDYARYRSDQTEIKIIGVVVSVTRNF